MGRFSVMGKVASGTAVDLFLAEDQRTGTRLVVEALRPELIPRNDLLFAVVQQARKREDLEHPYLSRRLRSVTAADGRHHWLSEPLQGDTLRAYLANHGPLRFGDALRVMANICDAVGYLHARGHVHGCLSPDYIVFDPATRRPKLLDTGLSLLRFAGIAPVMGNRVLVRPEYLSPERIQGQRADPQSDIYALGVLLYELLRGVAPFADRDVASVRQKHLRERLPTLPAEMTAVEPVLHACLAKVRSARMKNIALLEHALHDIAGRASVCPLPLAEEVTPKPTEQGPSVDVDITYPSRRAVLSSSNAKGSKLSLFVPTSRVINAGTQVKLYLSLGDSHRIFLLSGTAMSDSLGARGPRMSGFNIGFFGESKKAAAEMLAFCADRPPAMGTASSRRLPVGVACGVRAANGKIQGHVLDLSRTGAFVTTTDPHSLSSVSQVQLLLKPRLLGLFGTWVRGEVVWRGRKSGRYGVGVRFVGECGDVADLLDRHAGKRR